MYLDFLTFVLSASIVQTIQQLRLGAVFKDISVLLYTTWQIGSFHFVKNKVLDLSYNSL